MRTVNSVQLRSIHHMLTQSVSERDLVLLRQIEETVDQLEVEACIFSHYEKLISRAADNLKSTHVLLDKDGKLLSMFENARDAVESLYDHSEKQCQSARDDTALTEEDGVVEGYCKLLVTLAHLHRALNDLCWALGESTADHDTVLPGEFTGADDLFDAIGI